MNTWKHQNMLAWACEMVRTDNKGWFSGLIPRKQDFTLTNAGCNPADLRHICKRVTMSLLFSPIKILIVKAFVSDLQLTNWQHCTKGKSATQSNMPKGYTISISCMDLHTSAPHSLPGSITKSHAVERCSGASPAHQPGLHMQHQALTLGGLVQWLDCAAPSHLPRCIIKYKKSKQIFTLSAPTHTHRGCSLASQTMKITQFTFEPKIKDFKPQSAEHILPPLNPEVLFLTTQTGHAGTGSAQPDDFSPFPIRRLQTVHLCKNRIGRIFLLPLFVVLSQVQRQRDAGVVHTNTIYPEPDISPQFGSAYEGGHAPCSPPSVSGSNSSNTQTSINHLATDPASSPQRKQTSSSAYFCC